MSDDEGGELESAIRAERAKRAEQSNRSREGERVVEAGVASNQNCATNHPRHILFNSDDLGLSKRRDRHPMGDALLDGVPQVGAQRSEVTAQDHCVRIDDADDIVDCITQCSAGPLEDLQHRSLAFINGPDNAPNRFPGLFIDQPGRLIFGQQVADSQQKYRTPLSALRSPCGPCRRS